MTRIAGKVGSVRWHCVRCGWEGDDASGMHACNPVWPSAGISERALPPAEILAVSIQTFMTAMQSDFIGPEWDRFEIVFSARRVNEVTDIHGLTMRRGKP